MSRATLLSAIFTSAILFSTTPAHAQNITGDPDQIAAVLKEMDLPATVSKDSSGDPEIQSGFGDEAKFTLIFYNCTDGAKCLSVQFHASYSGSKKIVADINAFNLDSRWTHAVQDSDGDLVLRMDTSVAAGGMPKPLFKDNIGIFEMMMNKFSAFIYE